MGMGIRLFAPADVTISKVAKTLQLQTSARPLEFVLRDLKDVPLGCHSPLNNLRWLATTIPSASDWHECASVFPFGTELKTAASKAV
jgi:hypothetical protein